MQCMCPITIKNPSKIARSPFVTVPCGRCVNCKLRVRDNWAFRLQQEAKYSKATHFITLTYDDSSLPYIDGRPLVSKTDVQAFIKRLRNYQDDNLRYYILSEYGPSTLRPHYHGFIFNLEGTYDQVKSNLEKAWQEKGFVTVANITEGRVGYVSSFHILKNDIPEGYEPNFLLMSRRPGIGSAYIERYKNWHKSGAKFYCLREGVNVSMPRYYNQKIFSDVERNQRLSKMLAMQSDNFRKQVEKFRKQTSSSGSLSEISLRICRENFASDRARERAFEKLKKKKRLI